jgi:hypothetical protein
MFILSVGFCWTYKTGEKQAKKIPILIKTHGRKAKSIFKVGMDYIRLILLSIDRSMSKFKDLISCFSNFKIRRKFL